MSRKRGKKHRPAQAAPVEELLAEGSGPVGADAPGEVEGEPGVVAVQVSAEELSLDELAAAAPTDEVSEMPPETGEGEPPLEAVEARDVDDEPVAEDDAPSQRMADAELLADAEAAVDAEMESDPDLSSDAEMSAAAQLAADGDVDPDADPDADLDADASIATLPTSAASMEPAQLKQLVEALVFASDKPITVQRLRQLTRVSDVRRLEQALADLTVDYAERGLVLQQVSGGYQFRTRTQFSVWVQQLIAGRPVRLSRAQLETLAIIAYRQPITRPEIDDIRGVDSSATLKLLMDRALVRILGKKEEVGRPMLYGTTKEFLDFFSLGDLRELPTLREYSELSDESRRVMTDRLGASAADDDGGGDRGGGSSGGDDGDGGDQGGGGSGSGGDDGGGAGPVGGQESDGSAPLDDGGMEARELSDVMGDFEASSIEVIDVIESDEARLAEDQHETDAVNQARIESRPDHVVDLDLHAGDAEPFESTTDGGQSMVADVTDTPADDLPLDAVMAETLTPADRAEPPASE